MTDRLPPSARFRPGRLARPAALFRVVHLVELLPVVAIVYAGLVAGAPRAWTAPTASSGVSAVALARTATAPPAPAAPTHGGAYRPPLAGRLVVLRPFQRPPTPYSAGHRGVDLAASAGQVVLAAGGGRVSFAGPVAGRGVVVIAHPDGISTEYEPVDPLVRAGQTVRAGEPIGHLAGTHNGCPPSGCLHWGARRAGAYLNPMSLLRPLGPVRLLPWPGQARG